MKTRDYLIISCITAASCILAYADERTVAGHVEPYSNMVLTKDQLATRLNSVSVLIESSSVARIAAKSADPETIDLWNRARELHAQAAAALKAGDLAKTAALINEASRRMFECARIAAPKQVSEEKKRNDFATRLESVSALRDALTRVSAEKNAEARTAETISKVDATVLDAKIAAPVDIDYARALLDKAYSSVKQGVEVLRDGDTLVRSLTFASKADEYRYELDRNDTHQMLVTWLLGEHRKVGSVEKMVTKAVQEAARLRAIAEGLKIQGNYESAVDMLEQSTSELVRAIRAAGVDIPS